MKKSRLLGAVCAYLVVVSTNASAALIDNGNNTTTDDATGLTWLNLDQTVTLSADYVDSQLGSGGLFEGYR